MPSGADGGSTGPRLSLQETHSSSPAAGSAGQGKRPAPQLCPSLLGRGPRASVLAAEGGQGQDPGGPSRGRAVHVLGGRAGGRRALVSPGGRPSAGAGPMTTTRTSHEQPRCARALCFPEACAPGSLQPSGRCAGRDGAGPRGAVRTWTRGPPARLVGCHPAGPPTGQQKASRASIPLPGGDPRKQREGKTRVHTNTPSGGAWRPSAQELEWAQPGSDPMPGQPGAHGPVTPSEAVTRSHRSHGGILKHAEFKKPVTQAVRFHSQEMPRKGKPLEGGSRRGLPGRKRGGDACLPRTQGFFPSGGMLWSRSGDVCTAPWK